MWHSHGGKFLQKYLSQISKCRFICYKYCGFNKLMRLVPYYIATIPRNYLPYFPQPNLIERKILRIYDIEYAKKVLLQLS